MKRGIKINTAINTIGKLTACLLAGGMLLAFCACGRKAEEEAVLRIGIYEPLTGGNASFGTAESLGIAYAHSLTDSITIGNKEYDIQLVSVDNAAKTPLEAAEELRDAGVSVVLGSYGNEVSGIGGKVFGEAGIAMIGISCTGANLTADNDYFFRVCSRPTAQAAALGVYAYERLDAENAYVPFLNGDEEAMAMANAFAIAFHDRGGQVYMEEMPAVEPDLVTSLVRAADEGAEAYFVPMSPEQMVQLATLSRSLELQFPFLGTDWLDSRQLLEVPVDENSEAPAIRMYVSTFYTAGGNSGFDEGLRRYVGYNPRTNPDVPDPVSSSAALGYDAYQLVLKAVAAARSVNKADILAVMPSVISTGVTGTVSFGDSGDAVRDTVFVKRADYVKQQWKLDKKQEIPEGR